MPARPVVASRDTTPTVWRSATEVKPGEAFSRKRASRATSAAEGRLRALNVWVRTRSPKLPEVPTLIELGYHDMVVTSPYGVVGPLGMEPAVIRALHDGFRIAANDPAHMATLARLDQPLEYLGPEDYGAFIQRTCDEEEARVRRLGLATG